MAAFEYGAFFFWGDNEHGQLGNRKRSFVESPYPKRKFELYHNVENVIADVDSCAVIVESQGEKNVPKRKKKAKRSISASEILNSDEAIKAANEARMNKQKELDAAAMEKRVPLDQRFRTGWHKFMYGGG